MLQDVKGDGHIEAVPAKGEEEEVADYEPLSRKETAVEVDNLIFREVVVEIPFPAPPIQDPQGFLSPGDFNQFRGRPASLPEIEAHSFAGELHCLEFSIQSYRLPNEKAVGGGGPTGKRLAVRCGNQYIASMNFSAFRFISRNHYLLFALVKRDVTGKYRGSIFGLFWSIVEPMVLLAIYTLVFGGLFQLRLPYDTSISAYSLYIFSGLLVWLAISDGINRSTTVIIDHVNMVKKVIFPAEILPLQVILSAIIHQLIGLVVLAAGLIILGKGVFWSWLLFPLLLFPQFLITAGIGWLVASTAVFIRDIRQAVALGTVCWMFLTPIFYPEDLIRTAFEGRFAFWLTLNPAAALLHNYRLVFLQGAPPDWLTYLYLTGLGLALFSGGWWWFKKTQKSFADLI